MWCWLLVLLVIVLFAAFVMWKTRSTGEIDWSREAGGSPPPPGDHVPLRGTPPGGDGPSFGGS